ncbi:X-Pro aminopeptidase [Solitalea longa]|uniref:Xaa-Pro aminopeptidase n=1 Tax=Solitalea longa TaxID=2079460 RepID=A0A2S4ZZ11_9SPHI|nr:aminopeptidase P family protein [Solitalea longa]POY35546.1 X-Pro aminopeptidase [Solitalea longa]
MKYTKINSSLFEENRKRFKASLKPKSLALFNSNDEFPQSGDQTFPFKQNADLFYLSGIDQEQTILLIFPDCPNPIYREVLFLRKTNEHIAIWEGHKYTKAEAAETSGIGSIFWIEDFETLFPSIVYHAENIYLNTNENDRYVHTVPYRDLRFAEELKNRCPHFNYLRSAPIMCQLRMVKSDIEVQLTQTACDITEKAFKRVLSFTKPGVTEYEIEAEIIHEFIRNRATGHGYNPIIASGESACCLHYNENNKVCTDGEIILMDFGACYANYNADLTRSIPVIGRFSIRQKAIYTAVLNVLKGARNMLTAGTIWNEYHEEVGKIMTSELISIGLLDKHDVAKQDRKNPAYKKYFMHGTSHHLGLDVHDISNRFTPFQAGNILTCEPGIYIPDEKLGIRLENDIFITKDGNIDLMKNIPIEIEEIEELMNS